MVFKFYIKMVLCIMIVQIGLSMIIKKYIFFFINDDEKFINVIEYFIVK